MKTFITRCTVGDFTTDGEGNGKKISKKRAAEKMLEKLKVCLVNNELLNIIALPAMISRLRLMNSAGPGDVTKPSSQGWVKHPSPVP